MSKTVIGIDANARAEGAAAITKTADYNGAALDLGAGWAPDPFKTLGVLIDVDALDFTTTDETYEFIIEESSDNSTFTPTGCQFLVAAVGIHQQVFKNTKRYVRARLNVSGTTPSLTYSVWFGPTPI